MALLDNKQHLSTVVDGLDHPEGIAWGTDGCVYAGGEAGQLYRIDIEKQTAKEYANTGGFVLGMALDIENNVYACDLEAKSVLKITPSGEISTYSSGTPSKPMLTPNYPAFDETGNLYVCDSGEWKQNNGRIYRIDPVGQTSVWNDKAKEFPNGLCMGIDEKYLYVAMSLGNPKIIRIEINDDGSSGDIETVIELPKTVPDGVAFDAEGSLYIACYRPDIIYKYTPAGELSVFAEDFEGTIMAAPTNIAFCGENMDILLGANLGRWHITRYKNEQPGLKLHYPTLK